MRCGEARKLISDYVDGILNAKQNLGLKQHLESCSDCQQFLADFEGIAKEAKELGTPSPSEKVWLRIMERLDRAKREFEAPQRQKREWFNFFFSPAKVRYALGSLLVLLVVIGGTIVGLRYWRGEEILKGEKLYRHTLSKLDEAEVHYQLAIKALNEAISAQKNNLDPQVREVFQKNLELIDSTLEACRQAVLREPDDLQARSYLLTAYSEKVAFLNEIVEVKKISSLKKGSEIVL